MTVHIPVLPTEAIQWTLCEETTDQPDEQPTADCGQRVFIDGTLGGGGHTRLLLERLSGNDRLISVDRDPDAVEETRTRLESELTSDQLSRWTATDANYADLPEMIGGMETVDQVDGILLDLGLSSDQLDDHDRGFSYHAEGPLDLRFNRSAGEPASRLVNRMGEKHLANLIYEFGEERHSRRVARNICKARHEQKIETAAQLAAIVRRSVPRSRGHSIDPATRTFQALRIAVNEELKWLSSAVRRLPEILAPGGRLVVISFHSLEDRIVKHSFNESTMVDVLTRRPVKATEAEIESNPRSRSARMRVAARRVS